MFPYDIILLKRILDAYILIPLALILDYDIKHYLISISSSHFIIQFLSVQSLNKNLPTNIAPLNYLSSIVYCLSPVLEIIG